MTETLTQTRADEIAVGAVHVEPADHMIGNTYRVGQIGVECVTVTAATAQEALDAYTADWTGYDGDETYSAQEAADRGLATFVAVEIDCEGAAQTVN
ncbi:MAG: hypothetical protein OXG44_17360 [Gammaproteobacteria bacterium]|nr:hypothetical protein [Gammaproteobacteria bacterium]